MADEVTPPLLFSNAAKKKQRVKAQKSKTNIIEESSANVIENSIAPSLTIVKGFSRTSEQSNSKKKRGTAAPSLEGSKDEQGTNLENSDNKAATFATFEELGLSDWLTGNCRSLGMVRPTPVQCNCVPQILQGLDVMGTAETGSGKTAAFALPILQKLAEDPYGIFALILTPTRELATQIVDQFRALGAGLTLKDLVIIGGVDMTEQARQLCKRPHIVVATPGRLQAHFENEASAVRDAMSRLRFLVLDEADRLLERCFEDELRVLLQSLPKSRQTLLFSATLTQTITQLQSLSMKHAHHFLEYDGMKTVQSSQLVQEYIFLPQKVKEVYLAYLVQQMGERWGVRSAVMFMGTCKSCQLVSGILSELGHPHSALHAAKSQAQRSTALDLFRGGQTNILLATDVASRGLDIPTVDLVVNFDLPRVARDYVHRAGRTARAGNTGRCLSFVTQYDVNQVHRIEAVIEQQLEECKLDEKEVLKMMTEVFKAKRCALMKMSEIGGFDEKLKVRRELKLERRKSSKRKHLRDEDSSNGVNKQKVKS